MRPMLRIEKLNAWYGSSHVLQDVGIEVEQGRDRLPDWPQWCRQDHDAEVDHRPAQRRRRDRSVFKGKEVLRTPAHVRFALGLAYVPEERRIVQGLTVRENLRLGLVASPGKKRRGAADRGDRQRSFHASPSGWTRRPSRCPAANSRCWRSRGP